MSQEKRSPLARLQIAVGRIRQKPDQPESSVLRIEVEIERIDRLVGDLFKLSRMESGELTEKEEAVDMHELVHDVVSDADFEAQASGRNVVWHEQGSAILRGQGALLHDAIENVVRNSLKHAPETRIVRVETEVDTPNAYYRLRVLDAGPGVAEEELPRLFTPFFRAAAATPRDGYGLGLAVTRRVIELHGGTVSAVNRRGGGLCVEVELPLRQNRSQTRCLPTRPQ
jgi:signal transduction histidine kinase